MSSSTGITHKHIHTDRYIYIHIRQCSSMQTTHKLKKLTYNCTHPSTVGTNPHLPFVCGSTPKLSACKGCDHCITSKTSSSIPCKIQIGAGVISGRIVGESKDTFTVIYGGSCGIVCDKSLVMVDHD